MLHASTYNGQEIGAIQVLHGIENESASYGTCDPQTLKRVIKTYEEQYFGWKERNIFERQWVLRDFKKSVGITADEAYARLKALETGSGVLSAGDHGLLESLIIYWKHQYQLLQGFEKNKEKLQENGDAIKSWISDIETCVKE